MIKDLVTELYPLNRQINGADTDRALDIIGEHVPNWTVHRYAPGTECWTWTVPKRWILKDAGFGPLSVSGTNWSPIIGNQLNGRR